MLDSIRILTAEPDGDDGLIVTFSDGTTAGYVVEELLDLRPCREHSAEGQLGSWQRVVPPGAALPAQERALEARAEGRSHRTFVLVSRQEAALGRS